DALAYRHRHVNRCTRGKVLPPLVRDAGTRPLRLPPSALSLPSAPREDEQPLGRIRGPFHTPSHTTPPYQRAPTGRVDGPAPGPAPPPVSTPARKDVRRINGKGAGPPCTRVEDPRYRVALKRRTSVRGGRSSRRKFRTGVRIPGAPLIRRTSGRGEGEGQRGIGVRPTDQGTKNRAEVGPRRGMGEEGATYGSESGGDQGFVGLDGRLLLEAVDERLDVVVLLPGDEALADL